MFVVQYHYMFNVLCITPVAFATVKFLPEIMCLPEKATFIRKTLYKKTEK